MNYCKYGKILPCCIVNVIDFPYELTSIPLATIYVCQCVYLLYYVVMNKKKLFTSYLQGTSTLFLV